MFRLAEKGVGTIIGRKSVSNGREYTRVWVYIPTKVKEDTAFPFDVNDPCLIEIDKEKGVLRIKNISKEEALDMGWRKRKRSLS